MFDTSFSSKLLLLIHALLSTASRLQRFKKKKENSKIPTTPADVTKSRCAAFSIAAQSVKVREAERNEKKKRNADSRLLPAAAKRLWSGGGRRRKEGGLDGARTLSKALSLAAVSAARRTVRSERAELALGSA